MTKELTKYQLLVQLAQAVVELEAVFDSKPQVRQLRATAKKALAMKMEAPRNPNLKAAQKKGVRANKERAAEVHKRVMPIIKRLRGQGYNTYAAVAAELNKQKVPAPRGDTWFSASVRAVEMRE